MTRREFRRLFYQQCDRFHEAFPHLEPVRLQVVNAPCPVTETCEARAHGVYVLEEHCIIFAEKTLWLPLENVLGLVYHELGHASDLHIERAGAEQRADDLAEHATGYQIHYDSADLQTVGPGRYPRPLYLHR